MGRPLRETAGGVVYHVLNRRVLRLTLFEDDGDYLAFERVLGEAMQRKRAPELFAFCLMPNHWHLLVRPRENGDLSKWMQWLTVTHTHRWHGHHRTAGTGPLYQGRFKCFPVQTDEHYLTAARYVERNALRANLPGIDRAEQWRWSSLWLRGRSNRRRQSDVERDVATALADWPTGRPVDWLRRVNRAETQAELEALRLSVSRGHPFGETDWSQLIVDRLGLHTTLRGRGRPRKSDKST